MRLADLYDDGEFHNPLVPVALGLIALTRPLRDALERKMATATADPPSDGTVNPMPAPTAIHDALLGLIALGLRVESEARKAAPREPHPRARGGEPKPDIWR